MYRLFVMLLLLSTCMGCALMVAKETAKVVDIVLEDDPNPNKKKKIINNKKKKEKSLKERAKEFYCNKVKDKEKCNE